MFQKMEYTLEYKWDTLKSMMQSTESCNSDNHNLLKQQFIIYNYSVILKADIAAVSCVLYGCMCKL